MPKIAAVMSTASTVKKRGLRILRGSIVALPPIVARSMGRIVERRYNRTPVELINLRSRLAADAPRRVDERRQALRHFADDMTTHRAAPPGSRYSLGARRSKISLTRSKTEYTPSRQYKHADTRYGSCLCQRPRLPVATASRKIGRPVVLVACCGDAYRHEACRRCAAGSRGTCGRCGPRGAAVFGTAGRLLFRFACQQGAGDRGGGCRDVGGEFLGDGSGQPERWRAHGDGGDERPSCPENGRGQ